jgi:hypothetical protein
VQFTEDNFGFLPYCYAFLNVRLRLDEHDFRNFLPILFKPVKFNPRLKIKGFKVKIKDQGLKIYFKERVCIYKIKKLRISFISKKLEKVFHRKKKEATCKI